MSELYFSKEEFQNLTRIYPDINTPEFSDNVKKDYIYRLNDNTLIKTFFRHQQDYIDSKNSIVDSLMTEQKDFNLDFISYPTETVFIDNKRLGYAMNNERGKTLYELFYNSYIPFSKKIHYLWQIGKALEKMEIIRKETAYKTFFVNDIHEKNLIFNDENDTLKIIDSDAFYINNNDIYPSMYLRPPVILTSHNKKYYTNKNNLYGTQIVPTYNTELYCYTIIILNMLYGSKVFYVNRDSLLKYIEYLKKLNLDKDFNEVLDRLHSEKPNINPYEILLNIKENPYTTREIYEKTRRKI